MSRQPIPRGGGWYIVLQHISTGAHRRVRILDWSYTVVDDAMGFPFDVLTDEYIEGKAIYRSEGQPDLIVGLDDLPDDFDATEWGEVGIFHDTYEPEPDPE